MLSLLPPQSSYMGETAQSALTMIRTRHHSRLDVKADLKIGKYTHQSKNGYYIVQDPSQVFHSISYQFLLLLPEEFKQQQHFKMFATIQGKITSKIKAQVSHQCFTYFLCHRHKRVYLLKTSVLKILENLSFRKTRRRHYKPLISLQPITQKQRVTFRKTRILN